MSQPLVPILSLSILCASYLSASEPAAADQWRQTGLRRFQAPEANQGVAVDAVHFYAISNAEIGKYRKENGQRVAGWKARKEDGIKHLNAGVVLNGRLYCAHSNFPAMPEESSVEIFDTATMTPVERRQFDKPPGSLTWAVPCGTGWLACFAHYRKTSDPALSRVVKFDAEWRQLQSWSFPATLIQRFGGNSSSGGAFGPGGHLFVTGHDARELYVLDVPSTGTELVWQATVPISTAGQAFAWDPVDDDLLYSIERKSREVVVSWIQEPAESDTGFGSEPRSFHPTRCEGNGGWWFGCYGEPRILLCADETFRLTGRWEFDASYGLEAQPDGRLLIGRNVSIKGVGHAGRLVIGRADPAKGVILERP